MSPLPVARTLATATTVTPTTPMSMQAVRDPAPTYLVTAGAFVEAGTVGDVREVDLSI